MGIGRVMHESQTTRKKLHIGVDMAKRLGTTVHAPMQNASKIYVKFWENKFYI
jgi:hypothetical protein